jgi:hypothetical protein
MLPPQKLYPHGFGGAPQVLGGGVGRGVGRAVGRGVGRAVGRAVGLAVGCAVGTAVGIEVWITRGAAVGSLVAVGAVWSAVALDVPAFAPPQATTRSADIARPPTNTRFTATRKQCYPSWHGSVWPRSSRLCAEHLNASWLGVLPERWDPQHSRKARSVPKYARSYRHPPDGLKKVTPREIHLVEVDQTRHHASQIA